LDSMRLTNQKDGFTSTILFDETSHKELLTSEDTVNVLAALEKVRQPHIPPKLQDLVEVLSKSSCSQLPSCRKSDL
ncbi:hypothetical protein DSO57_1031907, partial [Entomophthora muscae]